jgi:GT2 family glycosyltransferase
MGSPRVHFVICTRNNRDIIGPTLQAISNQTMQDWRCTVVDGCSTDGTQELIRAEYPWAELIVKERDSGPAASRNIGLRHAQTPYVVLLDSDVRLWPEWTALQLQYLVENPQVGMVGGTLVYSDRPSVINAAYGGINRLGVAWDAGKGEPLRKGSPRPCLWLSTSALMLRRELVGQLGGFDESMFAFHEDVDFGWRSNLYGYPVVYNPNAIAVHQVHGTMNEASMGGHITHLLWRNRLRSLLINYQLHNVLLYGTAYLALGLLHLLAFRQRREKLSALAWNVRVMGETWSMRRRVQDGRKVPDRTLWGLFAGGIRGPGR